jgi:Fe2+ or Zn2+ uptake regulation protein
MQFNININQQAFSEIAPECDLVDAAIFDFINQFIASGKTKRIEDNGDWYWISYKRIIDENPILHIESKPTIYRRINKLVDAKILKRYSKNQKETKTYFGRGENFSKIIYNEPRSQMNEVPRTQMIDNHNTSNHNTKDHNNTVISFGDDKKLTNGESVDYSSFVDAFNDLYGCSRHVTENKRKNIRSRLQTFTASQIKQAWENRLNDDWLCGDGSRFMDNWKAAMRNDEKIDNYLNQTKKLQHNGYAEFRRLSTN